MKVCQKFVALAAALAVVGCSSNDTSGPPPSSGQMGSSGASSGETGSSGTDSGQAASTGETGNSGTSSGETGKPDAKTQTPDATTQMADASSGPTGTPDGSTCPTYPGVTVTNVDAGAQSPTWSCIEANCSMQLATCAADCKCNDLILKAFFASHDLASANASFKAALANGSPPGDAILVGVCLQVNQSGCPMWGSSSADAAAGD